MKLALAGFLVAGAVSAEKPTLTPLSKETVGGLQRILGAADVALIESDRGGRLSQITVISLVDAPEKLVHDVISDVGRYSEFVSNMSESKAVENQDGSVDLDFVVRYTVVGFNGTLRHRFRADRSIDLESTDPNDKARFRWELRPVSGGTILVYTGYTDVLHSPDVIRDSVTKVRTLEHGFALANQLVQVRSMRRRAESLAKKSKVEPVKTSTLGQTSESESLEVLLDRGIVALLHFGANGKIAEVKLIERVLAASTNIAAAIASPGEYARFIETVTESKEMKRDANGIAYSLELDWPLMSWKSRYLLKAGSRHFDVSVTDGDLNGARYRWEIKPKSATSALLVLSSREHLANGSLALRALFSQEPLFEPGFDVAFNLLAGDGVRARAEGRR